MFDVGFFELVMLAVVGILVIGPERLPELVKKAMLWRGRIKQQFSSLKQTFEQEIGADEIRQQLHNEQILKEYEAGKKVIEDLQNEMQALNHKVGHRTDKKMTIDPSKLETKDQTDVEETPKDDSEPTTPPA